MSDTRLSQTSRGATASAAWLATTPFMNAGIVFARDDKERARQKLADHFATYLRRCRVSVEMDGFAPEKGQGCVLCYNETSFMDVAAFGACMWPHIDRAAAADLYAYLPFGRRAARIADIEMVPRGNRAATGALMDKVAAGVAEGERLAWGGEGRILGKDGIGHFKVGASLIAIRAKAPIVPVVFHGGHDIMPLGSLKARPGTIRVRFGAPISTDGVKENQARDFADKLRESVVAIYEDLRQLSREANAGTSA